MAGEALALDAGEHVGKVEITGAGRQMKLSAVAPAVGEPHLFDPAHVEGLDKTCHTLGHEMRMVAVNDNLNAADLMRSK
jgi:hypothetical protein